MKPDVARVAYRAADIGRRLRWSAVAVSLLCAVAILWVLLRPDMWTSCLVLAVVALTLAVAGRDSR